jgi:hypothetical protein
MEMDKTSDERKAIEKMVTKVNALMRGHLVRSKNKKYFFLHLVTGKKPHEFKATDLSEMPTSKIIMVKLKEQQFKRL